MSYYSNLLVGAIETGCTHDTAIKTLNIIRNQELKVDACKLPFAVHTAERDMADLSPYIVWGISKDSVISRFSRAYKHSRIVTVLAVEFDGKNGKWIEKPQPESDEDDG